MFPNRRVNLPPVTGIAAAGNVGQFLNTRIVGGVRTKEFRITLRATVVIAAGGATAIINDGSLAAFFSQVWMNENGKYPMQTDVRAMVRRTEMQAAGTLGNKRLDAIAAGTYALQETIVVPYATNLAVKPWETAFVEINPNAPTLIGLVANSLSLTSGINVLATSANAITVSNFSMQVQQIFDREDPQDPAYMPLFRPTFRDLAFPITGVAFAQNPLYMQLSNPLRDLMIQQDSTPAAGVPTTVSDIITAYQFISDTQKIDGEGTDLIFSDCVQFQPFEFAGAISPQRINANNSAISTVAPFVDPSYLYRWFQVRGLLSNVLVPEQIGPNPRLLITGGAGAGTSPVVRVCLAELEKVPGVTSMANPFAV